MCVKWVCVVMLALSSASGQVLTARQSDNMSPRMCVLPPLPKNGWFTYVQPIPRSMIAVNLTVICQPMYQVDRPAQVNCYNGRWSSPFPKCIPLNETPPQTTTTTTATTITTTTSRTSSSQTKPPKETATPARTSLWHVAIYETRADQIEHICGGSLIKNDVVISAAHCFWSPVSQELPASQFKVAAGKIFSQYDDPRDENAQYSDVKNISITKMVEPCRQPDVALVTLVTPFEYNRAVKPVCLRYDKRKQNTFFLEGNPAMVATWVRSGNECRRWRTLYWQSLPLTKNMTCVSDMTTNTTGRNRVCAGNMNNAAHCEIDSGNGLVFYADKIPYLRAVTTNVIDHPECTKFLTRSFSGIVYTEDDFGRPFGDTIRADLAGCRFNHKQKDQDTETTTEFIPTDPIEDDGHLTDSFGAGSTVVPKLPGTSAPIYQWHVGIYSKTWTPFKQICGGSLVKRDFVISAAHCFWDDVAGQQPASQFAVAGGKVYRPWNITQDTSAQQSDVSRITLPVHFRGATTSFQGDIAILRLRKPFTYAPGVQPVCVNFNDDFMREQLQPGVEGTVCGWGLTGKNGLPSQVLTYLELPYVDTEDCFEQFADFNPSFLKYITGDKMCAGFRYIAKALCRGDSGGGYVIRSEDIAYLHGVASTAASNEFLCNTYTLGALTSIYAHRTFIRDNIPDVEKECAIFDKSTTERNEMTENVAPTGPIFDGFGGLGIKGQGEMRVPAEPAVSAKPANPTAPAKPAIPAVPAKPTVSTVPAVVGTGNGGSSMMKKPGNAVGTTPAFLHSYYPIQYFCNCNCKP